MRGCIAFPELQVHAVTSVSAEKQAFDSGFYFLLGKNQLAIYQPRSSWRPAQSCS